MKSESSFDTNAGRLVLNFTNTVNERPGYDSSTPATPIELLNSPEELLKWCGVIEFLSKSELSAITKEWKADPDSAEKMLRKIISIREELFNCFYSLISKNTISTSKLEVLNELIEKLPNRTLIKDGKDLKLCWPSSLSILEKITAPIIQDAVDLLTTEDLSRLRVCGAQDCGWLFFDRSKNGRKRWCDMADCGNREKQRKYQQSH